LDKAVKWQAQMSSIEKKGEMATSLKVEVGEPGGENLLVGEAGGQHLGDVEAADALLPPAHNQPVRNIYKNKVIFFPQLKLYST
jgi:hypothetical protein